MRIDCDNIWTHYIGLTEPNPAEGQNVVVRGQEQGTVWVSKIGQTETKKKTILSEGHKLLGWSSLTHSSHTQKALLLEVEVADVQRIKKSLKYHQEDLR